MAFIVSEDATSEGVVAYSLLVASSSSHADSGR